MKRIIALLFIVCLLASCTVYTFRAYEITISLINMTEDTVCYVPIINEYTTPLRLTKENEFTGTRPCLELGKQKNLRNPNEKNPLKKTLEQIEAGGTYTIQEVDKDGNKTQKYTIECTNDKVEDITPDDCLYRCYKITLDWNNKVLISE